MFIYVSFLFSLLAQRPLSAEMRDHSMTIAASLFASDAARRQQGYKGHGAQ